MVSRGLARIRSLAAATLLIALCASGAAAQTLRGRVLDPDQRPVPVATVLVLRGETVVATTSTGSDGQFGPLPLPAGEYEIAASASGLGSRPRNVSVRTGATVDVDIALAVTAVQEHVVVSAAQVETPLSRTPESITVIDRTELEAKQTATVADALRTVPGFHVAASGGAGALTSIFPRGGESDYTLVLVDGVPQNLFGGGFDAAHLGTAGLERIEIVRGPKSALYGNGAIGGVVHLITRQGGPARAQAAFEGGGYGFTRSTASASGSRQGWRWGAAFDRLSSDGDTRERANLGRRVANDDYERVVGSGSLGWSDQPARSLRVDVRGGRDVRGYPGPYGSDPMQRYGGLDLISRGRNRHVGIGASGRFGAAAHRHDVQATWFDAKSQYTSPYGTSDDRTRRTTARYQYDTLVRSAGVSAGLELLHERVDNTYITGAQVQPVPVSRNVTGLFVEARPQFGPRGLLAAGVRLERISRRALEASPGARPAFDADVVWSLNPKIAGAWYVRRTDAGEWTRLRASAGTGIKPPTGFDLAYTDNPSLKPERNRSVDAGLEQAFNRGALVAEATWFFNQYDDLIVAVGRTMAGASRYRTDNIANAEASGLETSLRWQSSAGLAGRVSWTWLRTEVLGVDQVPTAAPSPYAVGEPLVRRPRHQVFAEVTWSGRRGNAFLTIGGRGRMPDLEPNWATNLVNNPGYATAAFGGAVKVGRYVEVFGRVTNVFDTGYEEVFGYPALGRTATVGVRVAAGR